MTVDMIIRALDAWWVANPATTRDAVTAWLESVEAVESVDVTLDAEFINER